MRIGWLAFALAALGCAGRPTPVRSRACPTDDSELAAVAVAVRHHVEVEPAMWIRLPLEALGACDVSTSGGSVVLSVRGESPLFARSCWLRGGDASRACDDDVPTTPTTTGEGATGVIGDLATPTYTFDDGPALPDQMPVVQVEIGSGAQAFLFFVAYVDGAWTVIRAGLAWTT